MTPPDEDDDRAERTTLLTREQLAAALAAEDDVRPYLVGVDGAAAGRYLEITTTPLTIGRGTQQVLTVVDPDISRFHLQVSLVDGRAVVEDMGSTNGTFVKDERVTAPRVLQHGDTLRAGRQVFRFERVHRQDVERALRLANDLDVAAGYVLALLPPPLTSGPVRTAWHFAPSVELGGDGFGYAWLDADTFVCYLIDVSGHGAGSAMHSVTVLNLLRQRALPGADFANPADVLAHLNARFQMDAHSELYFTMWYGVYRPSRRTLTYASAGHHPAYLVPADRSDAQPLRLRTLAIGLMTDTAYTTGETTVPPGAALYLFSDGAYEIDMPDGAMWGLTDFVPLLTAGTQPETTEPVRLYRAVTRAAGRDPLADDFSMLVLSFT